ncbi:MAG: hypothetical protein QME51_11480, partial [Planctomycetota bacterium]|nr:hypothetical protein [Planctomycetota bacterium]
MTRTVTGGLIVRPEMVVVGCWIKVRIDAGAGLMRILSVVVVAVRPPESALTVIVSALLYLRVLKVANP